MPVGKCGLGHYSRFTAGELIEILEFKIGRAIGGTDHQLHTSVHSIGNRYRVRAICLVVKATFCRGQFSQEIHRMPCIRDGFIVPAGIDRVYAVSELVQAIAVIETGCGGRGLRRSGVFVLPVDKQFSIIAGFKGTLVVIYNSSGDVPDRANPHDPSIAVTVVKVPDVAAAEIVNADLQDGLDGVAVVVSEQHGQRRLGLGTGYRSGNLAGGCVNAQAGGGRH